MTCLTIFPRRRLLASCLTLSCLLLTTSDLTAQAGGQRRPGNDDATSIPAVRAFGPLSREEAFALVAISAHGLRRFSSADIARVTSDGRVLDWFAQGLLGHAQIPPYADSAAMLFFLTLAKRESDLPVFILFTNPPAERALNGTFLIAVGGLARQAERPAAAARLRHVGAQLPTGTWRDSFAFALGISGNVAALRLLGEMRDTRFRPGMRRWIDSVRSARSSP